MAFSRLKEGFDSPMRYHFNRIVYIYDNVVARQLYTPFMMLCPKCGNKNEVNLEQTACFRCGAELPAESPSVESVIQPAVPSESHETFLFATIYAWLCFFGCFVAICIIAITLFQFAKAEDQQRAVSKIIAMLLMIALWLTTGVSILRRKKSAIRLSYFGAAAAIIGILLRGIIPLDIILAIPTFAIVFYLRARSNMLT
jgi:uncharacterized membrane protein